MSVSVPGGPDLSDAEEGGVPNSYNTMLNTMLYTIIYINTHNTNTNINVTSRSDL